MKLKLSGLSLLLSIIIPSIIFTSFSNSTLKATRLQDSSSVNLADKAAQITRKKQLPVLSFKAGLSSRKKIEAIKLLDSILKAPEVKRSLSKSSREFDYYRHWAPLPTSTKIKAIEEYTKEISGTVDHPPLVVMCHNRIAYWLYEYFKGESRAVPNYFDVIPLDRDYLNSIKDDKEELDKVNRLLEKKRVRLAL